MAMDEQRINRASNVALVVLSLIAFLTVLTGYFQHHPPQEDEGAAAHIFQLSVGLAGLTGLVFLTTADWTQPLRNARRLTLPAVALILAFAALYYGEHYYWPAR